MHDGFDARDRFEGCRWQEALHVVKRERGVTFGAQENRGNTRIDGSMARQLHHANNGADI
jgi:hypothetical protein